MGTTGGEGGGGQPCIPEFKRIYKRIFLITF